MEIALQKIKEYEPSVYEFCSCCSGYETTLEKWIKFGLNSFRKKTVGIGLRRYDQSKVGEMGPNLII